MKRLNYILYLCVAIVSLLATSCKGPKAIPDADLVNIFHDAFVINAYIEDSGMQSDSTKVYEPILERYGYTVDDLHYTIKTFSERKSAMLSDIVTVVSERLNDEYKEQSYKVMILDTIDRVAQRAFTRVIAGDTLIRANKLKDSSKLRVRINDLVPGDYTVKFDYLIDSLDENRNSRVEVYLVTNDSMKVMRHTTMLARHRESKYTRSFKVDTSHCALYVNMFYHPQGEESKLPDVRIRDFEIERVLPADVAVDSLYQQQLNVRLFNHQLMTSFTGDTIHIELVDPKKDTTDEPQDSIALRAN